MWCVLCTAAPFTGFCTYQCVSATNTLCTCCLRSTTYTVLNALAGHFNSFGNNAPLPKKRLDRIVKVRLKGL